MCARTTPPRRPASRATTAPTARSAPKAPDNLLKLGMSLFGLGDAEKACLSYAELAQEFPNAPTHIEQALDRESTRAGCS